MEDPLQKAFKRIADIFAELEKDVIAMRLKEGRIQKAKGGGFASGPCPIGFNNEGASWLLMSRRVIGWQKFLDGRLRALDLPK